MIYFTDKPVFTDRYLSSKPSIFSDGGNRTKEKTLRRIFPTKEP